MARQEKESKDFTSKTSQVHYKYYGQKQKRTYHLKGFAICLQDYAWEATATDMNTGTEFSQRWRKLVSHWFVQNCAVIPLSLLDLGCPWWKQINKKCYVTKDYKQWSDTQNFFFPFVINSNRSWSPVRKGVLDLQSLSPPTHTVLDLGRPQRRGGGGGSSARLAPQTWSLPWRENTLCKWMRHGYGLSITWGEYWLWGNLPIFLCIPDTLFSWKRPTIKLGSAGRSYAHSSRWWG